MARELIFTPEAEFDSDEGYVWYESRRLGLGREFLTAVDAVVQSICRNPESYQILYKTYRRAVVRRFPYAVLYETTPTSIVIYAVFNCRQSPEKWQDRLR
jgi:plasmid stabilization system protein ParE